MHAPRPSAAFVFPGQHFQSAPNAHGSASIAPSWSVTSTPHVFIASTETKPGPVGLRASSTPVSAPLTKTDPSELTPRPAHLPVGAAHGRPIGTLRAPEAQGPFARAAGRGDPAAADRGGLGKRPGPCALACLGLSATAGTAARPDEIDAPAARAEEAHQRRRLGRTNPFADLFPGSRAIVAVARRMGWEALA